MPRGRRTRIAPGIYEDAIGLAAVVVVGSGPRRRGAEERFPPGTPIEVLERWQTRTRQALQSVTPRPRGAPGTLEADGRAYLATVTSMPSYEARRADLEAWFPMFGHRARHSIDAKEYSTQLNAWAEAGYAASTLNHRRQAIRAVDHFCDPGGTSVIDGTQRSRPPTLEIRAIAWPDVLELLDAMPPSKTATFLRVFAMTGWPPARLRRLLPTDVDWIGASAFLLGRQKGAGTASKSFPLFDGALEAVRAFFRVFPAGGGVSKSTMGTITQRAIARVNAARAESGQAPIRPDFRPYDFRHSFGTELYRRTGDLKAVAEIMDVSLETAERYTLGAVSERMRATIASMNTGGSAASAPNRSTKSGHPAIRLARTGTGWHVPTGAIGERRNLAENGRNVHTPDSRANRPRLVKTPRAPRKNV